MPSYSVLHQNWTASPEDYHEERTMAAGEYKLAAALGSAIVRVVSDDDTSAMEQARISLSQDAPSEAITIQPGRKTRVQLEIPEDYEQKLLEELNRHLQEPQGMRIRAGAPPIPLKMRVIEPASPSASRSRSPTPSSMSAVAPARS